MTTRKAPRQANIELLRVVSMLAVIAMHFLGVGGVMTSSSGVWFVVASTFYSLAIAATSCYVLIGGYFLATSKFRTGRIFRLLLEFFTYTFGIYLLFGLAVYLKNGDNIFSLHEFLTFYLFPIVHEENWFVTCYILMLLLAPFYNILLQNLTKKQHLLLIVLTVFLFSVVPTVIWHAAGQFLQSGGYSFVWFSVLYFVAAYFRLYGVPEHLKSWVLGLVYFSASAVTAALVNHEFLYPSVLTEEKNGYYFFFNYNFFTVFIASVAMFLLFHRVTIRSAKTGRLINRIASYSFAVFLIHTHPSITGALWKGIVHTERYVDSPLMLVGLLIIPPVIYALCMVVEQLRLWITKPVLNSERLNAKFAEWDERSEFNEVA